MLFFKCQAIKMCGPDVPFCAIGATIFKHAYKNNLTVLPAFLGHGIGEYFHGPPEIFHMCMYFLNTINL